MNRSRDHTPATRRARATATLGAALLTLLLGPLAHGGPTGERVVHGRVRFTRRGNRTIIRASDGSIINYRSFNISRRELVRFIQPSARARVLNRILSGSPTRINGSLFANGRVYLVNPAGIYFGRGSVVDVGALYAIAGNLTNRDFLAGVDRFTDLRGEVINYGSIHAADSVHLAGAYVANYGSIVADEGAITMTAGDEVLIGKIGGHIHVKVKGGKAGARPGVENAGTARAGKAVLLGAGDMYSIAIRNTGAIQAPRIEVKGGRNGLVEVAGTLDASDKGPGGKGGTIEVRGGKVALAGARLDASGAAGGGEILVGGDYQGSGGGLNASRTFVDANSVLDASALTLGDGGRVIIWADELTGYYGTIAATGGPQGGAGGFAEVSGKQSLLYRGFADLRGDTVGTLLLDPGILTVINGAGPGSLDGNLPTILFGDGGANETIAEQTLEGQGNNLAITLRGNTAVRFADLTDNELLLASTGGGGSLTVEVGAGGTIEMLGADDTLNTNGADFVTIAPGASTLTLYGLATGGGNATLDAQTINLNGAIALGGGTLSGSAATQVNVNATAAGLQNAIDVAAAGATITAADGTYTEDLTVNKANLTLNSVNGRDNTTIQLDSGVGINLEGGASGFTLGGAANQGFNVLSGATTTFNVQLANSPNSVTISHNTINTTGNASQGISIGAAGATGLTIDNNLFTAGDLGDGSIWGPSMVDLTATNNQMTGPAALAASGYAIQFSGVTVSSLPASTISGNTISNYAMGIVVSNGPGTADLTMDNNNISACTNAIRLLQYSPGANGDMTTVSLTNNTLANSTIGLRIDNGPNVLADQFTIQTNTFTDNPTHFVDATGLIDPATISANNTLDTEVMIGGSTTIYGTIQGAIDAASPGDTLAIGPGAYNESLAINKSLTLNGAQAGVNPITGGRTAGDANESITNSSHVITADNVTLDGLTLNGDGTGEVLVLIESSGGPITGTTIQNNFLLPGTNDVGVGLGGESASSALISNTTIQDNVFDGPADMSSVPLRIGAQDVDETYDVGVDSLIFTRNSVTEGTMQVYVFQENVSGVNIHHNDFATTSGVLSIRGNPAGTSTAALVNFAFENNSVPSSNAYGVGIDVDTTGLADANFSGYTRVRFNSFDGVPGGSGFQAVSILANGISAASTVVDASGNWWGANTQAGVQAEITTNVANTVDYTPWLDTAADTDGGAVGFVGDFATTLHIDAASPQAAATGGPQVGGRIQEAVDLALANATITAENGTYTGDVAVNTAGLTLRSQTGRSNTIIQLDSGVGINLEGGATGFTLGGAPIQGFNVLSGATTTFNVQLANSPNSVTISYNTINTTGNASQGISIGAAGATGLTIDNNLFTAGDLGDGSIWGPSMVDLTVTNNQMTGPAALAGSGYGIQFSGVTVSSLANSTISNNTIADYANAILISNGPGTDNLLIDTNAITGSTNAIRFAQYSPGVNDDMTGVTITNNTLGGTSPGDPNTRGILIGNGANVLASNFTIQNNTFTNNAVGLRSDHNSEVVTLSMNDFSGNTTFAVQANGAAAIIAEDNFWGTENGPAHAGNTFNVANQGDPVSNNVDYVPWLDDSFTTPGNSFAPVSNVDTAAQFSSLQAAINAAAPGQTIQATNLAPTPAIYTEDFSVTVANLTIRSVNGPANTTLLGESASIAITIGAAGSGLILGGGAGEGFTIQSGGGTDNLITLQGNASGVQISNNTLVTTGNAGRGINIGAGGAAQPLIQNNTFTVGDLGDTGVGGGPIIDLQVLNNTFNGPAPMAAAGAAIDVTGVSIAGLPQSTLTGNLVQNFDRGIRVQNGPGTANFLIDNNTISGTNFGVHFADDAGPGTTTNVTVGNNLFQGNNIGVQFDASASIQAGSIPVTGNAFVGSVAEAVVNNNAQTVNASGNWWDTNTPAGVLALVDAGAGLVDYNPWLDVGTNSAVGNGFVGDFRTLNVNVLNAATSPETSGLPRLQEGHDTLAGVGAFTLKVHPGFYNDGPLATTKPFTAQIQGSVDVGQGVTLGADLAFTASGNFPLDFFSTLNGPNDLFVDTNGGLTRFFAALGNVAAIGSGAGPAIEIRSSGITMFAQTIGTNSGMRGTGRLFFFGDVALGNGNTGTNLSGQVNFVGARAFSGFDGLSFGPTNLLSGGAKTITSNNSTIAFQSTIQGGSPLEVMAGSSMARFGGDINIASLLAVARGDVDFFGANTVAAGSFVSLNPAGRGNIPTVATLYRSRSGDLTINTSVFTMGRHEKLTVPNGILTINASVANIFDLSALGINVNAGTINIGRRQPSSVRVSGIGTVIDGGTDLVARDFINLNGSVNLVGSGPIPTLASLNVGNITGGGGLIRVQLDFWPGLVGSILDGAAFGGAGAEASLADISPALAGSIPRPSGLEAVTQGLTLSPAVRELLEQLGIFARDLTPEELARYGGDAPVNYDDIIRKAAEDILPHDHKVPVGRLPSDIVAKVVGQYKAVFLSDGEFRDAQLKGILQKAFDAYKATLGAEAKFDPAGFRKFVEATPAHADALGVLNSLGDLFARISQLGLTAAEQAISQGILVRSIVPEGMTAQQLVAAVGASAAE